MSNVKLCIFVTLNQNRETSISEQTTETIQEIMQALSS